MHGQTLDSSGDAVLSDSAQGGRSERRRARGPHALVALAAFAALVAGAVGLITLLVSAARLVQAAT